MIRRAITILLSIAPLLADAHPARAPITVHTASSGVAAAKLRFAGDLTARIAFEPDAGARRRAAWRYAFTLRSLAGEVSSAENETRAVLQELATALAAYQLPQIMAASRRRLALERRLSR